MENKFYVGEIFHSKKIKPAYTEKNVLFTNDDTLYLDLINNRWYSSDNREKDYVIKESLIPTNINDYEIDYMYLLKRIKQWKTLKYMIILKVLKDMYYMY